MTDIYAVQQITQPAAVPKCAGSTERSVLSPRHRNTIREQLRAKKMLLVIQAV